MKIAILTIKSATNEQWDEIWRGCDFATYFHSREWAEVWAQYTKGAMRPVPKLVTFSDGKVALLPLSCQKSMLFKNRYMSSPGGTFGGWISCDELEEAHGLLLAAYLTKKVGRISWRLNPYDSLVSNVQLKNEYDETHAIDLRVGFDTIYSSWRGNNSVERKARKARKEGVSVVLAATLEEWKEYFFAYEDSLLRWGEKENSGYKWELFETLFKLNSPHIKLWVGMYEGQVVAGALCFYAKKHVVYWHGAAFQRYFNLRPVNLVMCVAIEDACTQGYSWFDFNPSGGLEGVKAFKKSFGAKPLPAPIVTVKSARYLMVQKMSRILKKVTS